MSIPQLRAPIVLVHGLLGYDRIRFIGWTISSYFSNIPEVLTAAGNRVHVAQMNPIGSVMERAGQLKAFLDREVPDEPVHLIAHSMGGLDSRYMISNLGMAARVLTLTTLGTPHRGTSFADWGMSRFERLIRPAFDLFSLPHQAFRDLTTEKCRAFNAEVPDAPGVRYFSVAGRHSGSWFSPEWQLPASIIAKAEGPSDGIVSIASATYGESCEIWEGDHLSLINWLNPLALSRGYCRERSPQYAALLGRLADEGF